MGLCAKDGTDRVAIPPLRRDRCGSMVWVRCARGVAFVGGFDQRWNEKHVQGRKIENWPTQE